jgi:hypothetical protein
MGAAFEETDMKLTGGDLFSFLGFSLTAFVLLVSFYIFFIKNLYEALIQSVDIDEQRQKEIFKKITDYYYVTDLIAGFTTIYVFFLICSTSLLLADTCGIVPNLFFLNTLEAGMIAVVVMYFVLSIVAYLVAMKQRSYWFKRSLIVALIYIITPFALVLFFLKLLTTLCKGQNGMFFFTSLFIFCVHLFGLIAAQFLMPLQYWVEAIKKKFDP